MKTKLPISKADLKKYLDHQEAEARKNFPVTPEMFDKIWDGDFAARQERPEPELKVSPSWWFRPWLMAAAAAVVLAISSIAFFTFGQPEKPSVASLGVESQGMTTPRSPNLFFAPPAPIAMQSEPLQQNAPIMIAAAEPEATLGPAEETSLPETFSDHLPKSYTRNSTDKKLAAGGTRGGESSDPSLPETEVDATDAQTRRLAEKHRIAKELEELEELKAMLSKNAPTVARARVELESTLPSPNIVSAEVKEAARLDDARKWPEALHAYLKLIKEYKQDWIRHYPLPVLLERMAEQPGGLAPNAFRAIEKDLVEAARMDLVPAMVLLADGLRPHDPAASFNWMCAAASRGDVAAQRKTGFMLSNGFGCPPNVGKAVKYFQGAAEAGDVAATLALGECYLFGKGVAKNERQAIELMEEAAEAGDTRAQNRLGDCYYRGVGVEKDWATAWSYFKRAADHGNPEALTNLGVLAMNGAPKISQHDKAPNEKVSGAIAGAVGGEIGKRVSKSTGAPLIVGAALRAVAAPIGRANPQEAVRYFQVAAAAGNARAMFFLAQCLENGTGVARDLAKAAEWKKSAAEAGDRSAADWCQKHEIVFIVKPKPKTPSIDQLEFGS